MHILRACLLLARPPQTPARLLRVQHRVLSAWCCQSTFLLTAHALLPRRMDCGMTMLKRACAPNGRMLLPSTLPGRRGLESCAIRARRGVHSSYRARARAVDGLWTDRRSPSVRPSARACHARGVRGDGGEQMRLPRCLVQRACCWHRRDQFGASRGGVGSPDVVRPDRSRPGPPKPGHYFRSKVGVCERAERD